MRFLQTVAFGASALLGFAAAQSTVIAFTQTPANVTAGQASLLKWSTTDTTDPVTITLRKGSSANLATISVLTSSATGGNYTWIPVDSLADGSDYALEITQGDQINYSGEFSLSGANAAAVSSASVATSSASAYASSLTSSYLQSSSIASIQSVISSYNASLTNLTATANTSTPVTVAPAPASASASLGTGIPMSRNTTLSIATLSATSSTATITSTTTSSSIGGETSGTTSTASASATSTGAAAVQGLAGSSTLALVLCALAAVFH